MVIVIRTVPFSNIEDKDKEVNSGGLIIPVVVLWHHCSVVRVTFKVSLRIGCEEHRCMPFAVDERLDVLSKSWLDFSAVESRIIQRYARLDDWDAFENADLEHYIELRQDAQTVQHIVDGGVTSAEVGCESR